MEENENLYDAVVNLSNIDEFSKRVEECWDRPELKTFIDVIFPNKFEILGSLKKVEEAVKNQSRQPDQIIAIPFFCGLAIVYEKHVISIYPERFGGKGFQVFLTDSGRGQKHGVEADKLEETIKNRLIIYKYDKNNEED